ncbi:MAG: hypothetical protein K2X91_00685 [Thermoleophilia bacterium]|nr:hypothetical protein [Thermoleophilia bacterium]
MRVGLALVLLAIGFGSLVARDGLAPTEPAGTDETPGAAAAAFAATDAPPTVVLISLDGTRPA